MYHTIQFLIHFRTDLEVSRKHPLEQILIRAGTQRRVQLRPHVVETTGGPIEVADLFFEDGTTTRCVPYACFSFVD
jgi:hypothetical protein